MSSSSDIAVVVSCYDLGRTIEEAVDSVLVQSRPAEEIVVIDDGSTDVFTRQVIARLDRPRTRVVTAAHAGVAMARNRGVELTRAPYIVLLDGDDVLAPHYLERAGSRLDDDPEIGFVSCAVQAFEGASYTWKPPSTTIVGTLTRGSAHVSSMFRRTLWDAVGGFDTGLPAYEDLDFWVRALRLGFRGDILEEPLLFYRVRAGSRYRKGIEPARYRQAMRAILERHHSVISANGLGVLIEKESFLIELRRYHEDLLKQRKRALHQLGQLDEEIASARRAAGGLVGSAEPHRHRRETGLVTRWIDSVWKHEAERFVEERRWLVRGRVLLLSDRRWALDDLKAARWDQGTPAAFEERRPLDEAAGLAAASYDCAIVLLLAPIEPIERTLRSVALTLKPGGALILVAPLIERERIAEEGRECPPGETWMRSALALVFPLEGFDVELRGDAVIGAWAQMPPAARQPRLRHMRQTAPTSIPRGGLVLAYHRIAQLSPDSHRLCVTPEHFREHLQHLRRHCTVMPLVELFYASRQDALPPRAVAVTFDDGYLDALTTAAPILVEERVPATFFVNSGQLTTEHETWQDVVERILLDDTRLPPVLELAIPDGTLRCDVETPEQRRAALASLHRALVPADAIARQDAVSGLCRWAGVSASPRPERRLLLAEEVLSLSRLPGCEIGSHSEHHLLLPRHAVEVQRAELLTSKRCLEALLDRSVISFAYPFGEHDGTLEDLVRSTPYLFAVTVEPGLVAASTDPMRLPRLEVADGDGATLAQTLDRVFDSKAGRPLGVWRASFPAARFPSANHSTQDIHDRAWEANDRRSHEEHRSGRVVLSSRPQFLIIDPSSRCNARCVMCPVSFRAPGDHGTDLAPSIFEKLAPLIPTASEVNLFSSGEPTIARDIVHLLDETDRLSSRYAVIRLSTNGKRLPADVLDRLIGPRMGLQFSVDGGTKEVFETIRRGITFEELCASLEKTRLRKATLPYPVLSFSSTISKRNIHDLANIFDLAERYGVEHIYFYEEDPEVAEEEQFLLDETDRRTFELQRQRIDATGISYSNGLYFRGLDGLRAAEPEPPSTPPPLHCLAPWKVFHQRADGTVRTCCTLRKSMGDLRRQTFDEVWNGEEYVRLRRAFVEQAGIPGTCYRCTDPLRTWGGA